MCHHSNGILCAIFALRPIIQRCVFLPQIWEGFFFFGTFKSSRNGLAFSDFRNLGMKS